MNSCNFTGRICSDIESRTTGNGAAVCSFRLAVQRRFKDASGERKTDFISCVAWRQTAEFVTRYLSKGDAVAVHGELQVRDYQTQDGSKRYVTEIICDNVESIDSKRERSEGESETVQRAKETFGAQFVEVDDDSLPF